jgi:hypothetical protein
VAAVAAPEFVTRRLVRRIFDRREFRNGLMAVEVIAERIADILPRKQTTHRSIPVGCSSVEVAGLVACARILS